MAESGGGGVEIGRITTDIPARTGLSTEEQT